MVAVTVATLGYGVWESHTGDAAGILNRRLIIPGLAMDSQVQTLPANGSVVITVDMERNEPALTGGGTTTIGLAASASGPLPAASSAAVPVSASVSIVTHPGDLCAWNIEYVSGNLVLNYSRAPVSGVRLTFGVVTDIAWYYSVQCPGPTPPIRFPAGSINESVGGWLGLVLPGTAGQGLTIDVPVVTDPTNVFFGRCRGDLEKANEFGTVTIHVTVEDASCKLPAPTAGPTQSPYEPGLP
jgi:hypothetical protein